MFYAAHAWHKFLLVADASIALRNMLTGDNVRPLTQMLSSQIEQKMHDLGSCLIPLPHAKLCSSIIWSKV